MFPIKGSIIVKLILAVCFLSLLFIVSIHKNIKIDIMDFFDGIKINAGNAEREIFPERKRPFSLVRQETELKLLLPNPFVNFSRQEWEEFWNLIYGLYGYDVPENPRLPYIQRQLNLQELEGLLKTKYEIFKQFQGQHWEEFWKIVLHQKRFRRSW